MSSFWLNSITHNFSFSNLEKDIEADVCVIGAGIFGITCAYYLTKLGYKVVILEKDNICEKTTGHTTAKITSQHGLFYDYLISNYGVKFAKDYLDVNELAIRNIENIIREEKISCDFSNQNSYLYSTTKKEKNLLEKEFYAISSLGYNCDMVTKVSIPIPIKSAICFKNQAQFNPVWYLYNLCNIIDKLGGEFYSNTKVSDIKFDGRNNIVFTEFANVKCPYVIVATHYPFLKLPGLYFSKMYQSTSYIVAADIGSTLPKGMYLSASSPTFSYRGISYNGKNILLCGGGDHKTGLPVNYESSYGMLENEVLKYYPNCNILYRWNTEDCISLDKIPYIGPYSSLMPNVFTATGFKKWGMTFSNVAANIIVDSICNKKNKFSYMFNPSRFKPLKNFSELKNILIDSTNSILLKKLSKSKLSFDDIPNDSGGIIDINNTKVGIYKDVDGKIYAVKPICTHLGCLLAWNDVDKTWDCPCHGSRFDFKGKNLYNPGNSNLIVYDI